MGQRFAWSRIVKRCTGVGFPASPMNGRALCNGVSLGGDEHQRSPRDLQRGQEPRGLLPSRTGREIETPIAQLLLPVRRLRRQSDLNHAARASEPCPKIRNGWATTLGPMGEQVNRVGGAMALVVARPSSDVPDDDLVFWLSRPVAERIAAVEVLRRRVFGGGDDATGPRLQRVCRVVQRP